MYVKRPLKHHRCLIIELSCFQQQNAVAFGTSEYYKNGLLMDEHLKGCSSPRSTPLAYKLVLVSKAEGTKSCIGFEC